MSKPKTELQAQRHCYKLALLATCFALCVAVLGAYTRLTDAGLGCPDWPGCYGQLILSKDFQSQHFNIAGFNLKKAWTEMVHRYLAGLLGLFIFYLAMQIYRLGKKFPFKNDSTALKLSLVIAILVIFQALLGMWTVTLKLLPVVVMAHLLGGFSMISLLTWLSLTLKPNIVSLEKIYSFSNESIECNNMLKIFSTTALTVLILQLFLGGWTSANYAALVCLDFPACYAGQFFPTELNLTQAFNLFAERNSAGITIHMAHRVGALFTALILYSLCFYIYYRVTFQKIRKLALLITVLLSLQLFLGILNVIALLPLWIAVAHHAVAILLLLSVLHLHYALYHFKPLFMKTNASSSLNNDVETNLKTNSLKPHSVSQIMSL